MQSDIKQITKITSKRTNIEENLYLSVANFVFSELHSIMRRPPSLIIKLKGIGYWFLRKARMQKIVDENPPDFDKKEEDFKYFLEHIANENRKEVYAIFLERLKDYEKYLEKKGKIRIERNKTQTLIEINEDQEE